MRIIVSRLLFALIAAVMVSASLGAQQAPEGFRWIDFHADRNQKDQDIVVWVTRSLVVESWTAIREIGVEYDAALVVTTQRATPQAVPSSDSFTVWSVSLTTHEIKPLLSGNNLRWLDWMRFAEGAPMEPAILYESCIQCLADTYFTAFHYDQAQHAWTARWMRGRQAVPLWSSTPPDSVLVTQVYAGLAEPNGRELIGTWNHFDFGKQKHPEDILFRYDLDPMTGEERTRQLTGKDADAFKVRLCSPQGTIPGLVRGQDSPICQPAGQTLGHRWERKPVTTPPANNHGLSVPPPARH
jgi:hypothetical protein